MSHTTRASRPRSCANRAARPRRSRYSAAGIIATADVCMRGVYQTVTAARPSIETGAEARVCGT
jgi:hypothetical protein